MRRFRQGATKGPGLLRPGAGYGRICFGAPGPTQEVEPREELEPEHFTGEELPAAKTFVSDFNEKEKSRGDTIIDLTNE